MEAQLLQVSLPEIQELYQTLLAKPSPVQQAGNSSPVRPGSEKVGIGVWCHPSQHRDETLSLIQERMQTIYPTALFRWLGSQPGF